MVEVGSCHFFLAIGGSLYGVLSGKLSFAEPAIPDIEYDVVISNHQGQLSFLQPWRVCSGITEEAGVLLAVRPAIPRNASSVHFSNH